MNIVDRALSDTYPAHPDLGPGEVRVHDARRVLGYVERARQVDHGRVDDINDAATLRSQPHPGELMARYVVNR